jgi:hypothetical protein
MKWLDALRFGLKVFRMVEPAVNIKGIPVSVIDDAVTKAAAAIIAAKGSTQ